MENEPAPTPAPSAADAAALLSVVEQADAAVADRLSTPWWYHPSYALLTGMIVAAMGMPHGWGVVVLLAGGAGLGVLLRVYRNLTGLGVVTGGGRRVALWMGAVVVAAVAAIAVILVAHRPVVTVIATLAFMPLAVFAGRRVDDAMRDSLRRPRRGSR